MLILAAIFVFIPLLIVVFRGLSNSQLIINVILSVVVAPIGVLFAMAGFLSGEIGGVFWAFTIIIPFVHALTTSAPDMVETNEA